MTFSLALPKGNSIYYRRGWVKKWGSTKIIEGREGEYKKKLDLMRWLFWTACVWTTKGWATGGMVTFQIDSMANVWSCYAERVPKMWALSCHCLTKPFDLDNRHFDPFSWALIFDGPTYGVFPFHSLNVGLIKVVTSII